MKKVIKSKKCMMTNYKDMPACERERNKSLVCIDFIKRQCILLARLATYISCITRNKNVIATDRFIDGKLQ